MIDLHNHILPGLDDGAADLDESVAMARSFVEEGVETIAATPHLDPLHDRGARGPQVRRSVSEVQEAVHAAGIPLTVLPGNELFLTPDAVRLAQEGIVTGLNGGKYILVEVSLSVNERPMYLDDVIFQLQLAGFQPILGHPERYPFVQRDVSSIQGLVDRGLPLQLTAPSLLGEYGSGVRRTAERLLQRGAYSLAASDRHHPGPHRSLADLHRRLSTLHDPQLADLLLKDNPARVLKGWEPVPPQPPEGGRQSFIGRLFTRN